jgi:hypothetical protein
MEDVLTRIIAPTVPIRMAVIFSFFYENQLVEPVLGRLGGTRTR